MKSIQIPKGTKDILPSEILRWRLLEEEFRNVAELHCFEEIRTPVFEYTELFQRGVGDSTDIVQKEMYTFEIGRRSLTLKPEGTAPVIRSFIENKLYAGVLPAKYYYITPCFRYENTQTARQRQFHQLGVEILGSNSMQADAEIIRIAMEYLEGLGISDITLKINSVGCPKCRGPYRDVLKAFIKPNLDSHCRDCQSRYDKNPLRILDCKEEKCRQLVQGAPRITDYLCDECASAFEDLKKYLTILEVPFEVDTSIVRGLDYYTKTAFEILSAFEGAQGTICGGGRYDGLAEEIGGPSVPGVGFGMGIERVLNLMEQLEITDSEMIVPTCDVFIATIGEDAEKAGLQLAKEMREAGIAAGTDVMGRNLKAQLKHADRLGTGLVVVIGSDELASGRYAVRDMENSEQEEVPAPEVCDYVLDKLEEN